MSIEFLNRLKRGVSNLINEEELLSKIERKKSLNIKIGIDPTAPTIHLGHTVILNKLKLFQDYGHKIIFIIGDFTAKIGDPSGRDETRPILSEEEILKNAELYKEQISKLLDVNKLEIVFNSNWLSELFMKDNIKMFIDRFLSRYTVQQLLQREEFTKRQAENKPITLLEFIYPLFQAYDSVKVNADVELGGNDQLFNLLFARQMQKDFGMEQQVVITLPLLPGTDGVKKMSKSYNNYISINDPPNEIYGKIMSISDETMYVYYELLTEHDMNEIKELPPKQAKEKIAFELTERYYNRAAAEIAQEEFRKIFSRRELPTEIPVFNTEISEWKLSHLLYSAGLTDSKKEAQRLIKQKAVEINNNLIETDSIIQIKTEDIIKVGKRKFVKIKIIT